MTKYLAAGRLLKFWIWMPIILYEIILTKFFVVSSRFGPYSLILSFKRHFGSAKEEKVMSLQKMLRALLLLILIIFNFLQVAESGMAGSSADSDYRQMLKAARTYVKANSVPGINFDLKVIKQVDNHALLEVIPKGKWAKKVEPAGVILKKFGNKWVPQTLGTDLSDWERKVPELFK